MTVNIKCKDCGSTNVTCSANVTWDAKKQEWIDISLTDDGHVCEDCESENISYVVKL